MLSELCLGFVLGVAVLTVAVVVWEGISKGGGGE